VISIRSSISSQRRARPMCPLLKGGDQIGDSGGLAQASNGLMIRIPGVAGIYGGRSAWGRVRGAVFLIGDVEFGR
jgi:hypothetical protein